MGEVYRARDTRLDRMVAIKVLPREVAADADLRARFEREARAIAALDHPHICAVYDVGHHDGVDFLVMPYLEGETLAARLAKASTGLPLAQALKIGMEVADALDKTHRAGITHRDLKPANVMLTKSGAKLLDFGLAKLRPAAPISLSGLTRLETTPPGTASGTILGTVHYMAPEQVEGRDADARSDIWALGAVVYEMVTGGRPFDGESPASVIGAILKDDPPRLSTRQPLAPPALDHIVERCLAKDRDERWQNAGDAEHELEWVADTIAAAAPMRLQRLRYGRTVAGMVAAVVVAVAIVLTTRSSLSDVSGNPVVTAVDRVTHEAGFSEWPTWSPDGRVMAFSSNRTGNFEIYVRRVDGGEDINVTNDPAEDIQPAFSPDGAFLAFVSTRMARVPLIRIGGAQGFTFRTYGGDVWVMPAFGGVPRRIAERANFPIWQPDGRGVTYVSGREGHRSIQTATVDGTPGHTPLADDRSSWEIMRIAYAPGVGG